MTEIKISYTTPDGYWSTAYVTEHPDERGHHHGVNKHTDEPVTVRWDDTDPDDERWREVKVITEARLIALSIDSDGLGGVEIVDDHDHDGD